MLAEAVANFDQLDTQVAEAEADGKPLPAPFLAAIDNLKLLAAQLQGNDDAAGELVRDRAAGLRTPPPELIPLARPAAATATGAAAGAGVAEVQFLSTAPVRQDLANESAYAFTRGVLALLAGRPADARQWFERTRYPQGVNIAAFDVPSRAADADLYLRLINTADTPTDPR